MNTSTEASTTSGPTYSSTPSQIYGRSVTQNAQNQMAAAANGGSSVTNNSGQKVHGDVKFAEDGSTLLLPPGTKLTAKGICSNNTSFSIHAKISYAFPHITKRE